MDLIEASFAMKFSACPMNWTRIRVLYYLRHSEKIGIKTSQDISHYESCRPYPSLSSSVPFPVLPLFLLCAVYLGMRYSIVP